MIRAIRTIRTIRTIFMVCLVASLTACATVHRTESSSKRFTDLKSAVTTVRPLAEVQQGSFVNVKILDLSPSMSMERSSGKFEIVQLRGSQGQPFKIQVASVCDCLGFKKWAVLPEVYLLDANGNVVAREETFDPKTRLLKGSFPADGNYSVLVIANDRNIGVKIGDAVGGVGANTFTIPETAHPTGLVNVRWF